MKLLVDIGNSCVKWATHQAGVLSTQHSFAYQRTHLAALLTQQWLPAIDSAALDTIGVANVAGAPVAATVTEWTHTHWGKLPRFVKTTATAGAVRNGYHTHEQLGVDRWLAIIGAHYFQPGQACIIVDCGTAMTLDVVTASGQHLGGLIVPGLTAMQQALQNQAPALTNFEGFAENCQDRPLLARDTQSGMRLGILYTVIGFIEYVKGAFVQSNPQGAFTLVVTGGHAPLLLPLLPDPYQHIPDLVLRGLLTMVDKNL